MSALDWSHSARVIPLVRSKFLEHDRNVADALIRTSGVVVVSFANESLEPGVIVHGRTQDERAADLERYNADGACGVAGVVCDPAQAYGGPLFEPMLRFAVDRFPRTIIYALRAKSRDIATQCFGNDWETRRAPDGSPTYEHDGNQYVAAYVHPSIAGLIGRVNNGKVRLCLKSAAGTFCGGCHIPGLKGLVARTAALAESGREP